nr:hypothetical protein CFP56_15102 [Quercus suber]
MQLHPHTNVGPRSPTLRQVAPPYPIHSTSPPPTLRSACTQSNKEKFFLTPTKPISLPTSLIHYSHVAGETLLSNPPSTIPDPPKIDPSKTDLDLDPPKTDLVAVVEDRHCC